MAGTVTVASKLPFPLALQLQAKVEGAEKLFDGTMRGVERYIKSGKTFVINGCAVDRGAPSEKTLVGGFALTHGVDADFWAEWAKQHESFPPYENGLIFAHEKTSATESEARNCAKLQSGLEPVDPDNLPAEFKADVRVRAA